MTKQKLRRYDCFDEFSTYEEYDISDLIELLKKKRNKLVTEKGAIWESIKFSISSGYECGDNGSAELEYYSLETDEEEADRIKLEKKYKKQKEAIKIAKETGEYQKFVELKKKFGSL